MVRNSHLFWDKLELDKKNKKNKMQSNASHRKNICMQVLDQTESQIATSGLSVQTDIYQ